MATHHTSIWNYLEKSRPAVNWDIGCSTANVYNTKIRMAFHIKVKFNTFQKKKKKKKNCFGIHVFQVKY